MDSSEANISTLDESNTFKTSCSRLVLFSVDGKIQLGLYALETKEWKEQWTTETTSNRRAALIWANTDAQKEKRTVVSLTEPIKHTTLYKKTWIIGLYYRVRFWGMYAEKEQKEKKKHFWTNEEEETAPHQFRGALFRDSRVEYLQSWLRNDLSLAEVRLKNQTDGEISAFWNIWTKLRPVGVCGHAVNKVLALQKKKKRRKKQKR